MVADPVSVSLEGDEIIVSGPDAFVRDRNARLFFESILGASRQPTGWRCPRRRNTPEVVVLRVNTFLQRKGWELTCDAAVQALVDRDLERQQSFQRAVRQAGAFREGRGPVSTQLMRRKLVETGWNAAVRPLYDHQELAVLHGLAAANPANFSVPGAGKTASTLALAALHIAARTVSVVVVVGPLSCFRPWELEAAACLSDHIRTRRVRGTALNRATAYEHAQPGDLLIVSYASAAADRSQLIDLCAKSDVMLVVDEAHRIKRFRGGVWAPALIEIARHARVRVVLSGTPMPQNGRDLYSPLNVLWPAGELTGPRDGFAARVDRDFQAVIAKIAPFVSRTPKSALGLPPYEVVRHLVPLGPLQTEIYLLVEDNFRRRIDGAASWQEKIEVLRRGRPIRLLQAATNPNLLNSRDSALNLPRLPSAGASLMDRLARYRQLEIAPKHAYALSLVVDAARRGAKVVCWSTFLPNLDQFAELTRAQRIATFQVDGRVPAGDETSDDRVGGARANATDQDTREDVIARFLVAKGAAVLVANPASCSESISLHSSCREAIYLDRTYDAAQFLQSIDRIHRLGLPPDARVRIHLLIGSVEGRATIDGLVDSALIRKQAVMQQLLEGTELRALGLNEDALEDAEGDEEDLAALLRFLLGGLPGDH